MPNINDLIDHHDWAMLSWRERYEDGIWVALATSPQLLINVANISTDFGDVPGIELSSYFREQGSWLPVAKGPTFSSALNQLELKTASVPDEHFDLWYVAVRTAYESIYDVAGHGKWYALSAALDEKNASLMVPPELTAYHQNVIKSIK